MWICIAHCHTVPHGQCNSRLIVISVTHLTSRLLLIYQSQKDERLSRPGWLAYCGQFTHIVVTCPAVIQVQDRESSTTVPCSQPLYWDKNNKYQVRRNHYRCHRHWVSVWWGSSAMKSCEARCDHQLHHPLHRSHQHPSLPPPRLSY